MPYLNSAASLNESGFTTGTSLHSLLPVLRIRKLALLSTSRFIFLYLGSLDSAIAFPFPYRAWEIKTDQCLYFNKIWKSTRVISIFLRYYFTLLVLKTAACLLIKAE